ncbi:hypothetical protein [Neorhizobium sp. DT-125]|uniref:hypothetical protein n=1 Tax=Neorhizobium sp. DT-125 TaxID=3396163 RepID=UPI003F1CE6CA
MRKPLAGAAWRRSGLEESGRRMSQGGMKEQPWQNNAKPVSSRHPMNKFPHDAAFRPARAGGEPVETGDYLGKVNLKSRRSSVAMDIKSHREIKPPGIALPRGCLY